jgi:hypothetical protein
MTGEPGPVGLVNRDTRIDEVSDLRRMQYFVAGAAERNFTRSRPTSDGPAGDADAVRAFFATAMTHDEPGSVELYAATALAEVARAA